MSRRRALAESCIVSIAALSFGACTGSTSSGGSTSVAYQQTTTTSPLGSDAEFLAVGTLTVRRPRLEVAVDRSRDFTPVLIEVDTSKNPEGIAIELVLQGAGDDGGRQQRFAIFPAGTPSTFQAELRGGIDYELFAESLGSLAEVELSVQVRIATSQ